jgi:hypothetical protein
LCHSACRSGMVPLAVVVHRRQNHRRSHPAADVNSAALLHGQYFLEHVQNYRSRLSKCVGILWSWYPGYSLNCLIRSCLWNNLFSIFIISHCSSCRYLFTTLMVGEAKAVLCMSCCPWDPDCHQRRFNTRTYQAGKNSLLSFMLKVVLWLTITLLSLAYSSTFCSNNTCNILMW